MAVAVYLRLGLSLALLVLAAEGFNQPPAVPAWPDKFTVQLTIFVEKYGKDWSSKGVLYYDWTSKVSLAEPEIALRGLRFSRLSLNLLKI